MSVSLVDEAPGRFRQARSTLTVPMPTITVRELIRVRLELELEKLLQPDFETLVGAALEGFERRGFIVLVNDRQVVALDEIVPLSDASEVTFVRLIPLQGS